MRRGQRVVSLPHARRRVSRGQRLQPRVALHLPARARALGLHRAADMSRRLAALLLVLAACSRSGESAPRGDDEDAGRRYLDDAAFRGAELAASLVNHENAYSRTRLARYAAWEALPAWNPRVNGRA